MVCNEENWVSIEQFIQHLGKKKKKAKNIVSQIKGSFGIGVFCLPQYFNLQLPRDRNPPHADSQLHWNTMPKKTSHNPFKSQVSLVRNRPPRNFPPVCREKWDSIALVRNPCFRSFVGIDHRGSPHTCNLVEDHSCVLHSWNNPCNSQIIYEHFKSTHSNYAICSLDMKTKLLGKNMQNSFFL